MIFVVLKKMNENGEYPILNRCDAWEMGGQARMIDWAVENGYDPVDSEITSWGDMVIWCM